MPQTKTRTSPKGRVTCPYCHRDAVAVRGNVLYPARIDLFCKWFYRCDPCDAHVGCHPKTMVPLGSLANFTLRRARNRAHAIFDPIWRSGEINRIEAYAWLSEQLGVSSSNCHIAMMNKEQCDLVVAACVRRKSK